MNSDPQMKSAGRWALTTSILTAMSLLMCLAFADSVSHKLGLPAKAFYIAASISGLIAIVLNISADGGLSQPVFKALAIVQSVLIFAPTVPLYVFIVLDSKGGSIPIPSQPDFVIPPTPTGQVIGSIAMVGFFCFAAIFSLMRLVNVTRKI